MKKVIILGHFASGTNNTNGQTIKTKVIATTLTNLLGAQEVGFEDTQGRWRFLLRLPSIITRILRNGRNIIIMPAYKGVRIITPLLTLGNLLFHRRLHYVVIGGWLPDYAKRMPWLRACLKRFHGIYVETQAMQHDLEQLHFHNIHVMPNCKPLDILPTEQLSYPSHPPYRLCTFSRVIKEKGIEDAIEAVKQCNSLLKDTVYTLDIYGQIEQPEWFNQLMDGQPDYIAYKGVVAFNKSTEVLKDYFALLFPTYYRGEAFAGTLIDAMAAGLPIIASDWHANPELVTEGETGLLFPTHSTHELTQILLRVAETPDTLQPMRKGSIARAAKYQPETVIQTLTKNLA